MLRELSAFIPISKINVTFIFGVKEGESTTWLVR